MKTNRSRMMKGVIAIGLLGVLAACGERAPSLPVSNALSPESARHFGISWSPDGKRIAYWEPVADSSVGATALGRERGLTSPIKLPVDQERRRQIACFPRHGPRTEQSSRRSSQFSLRTSWSFRRAGGPRGASHSAPDFHSTACGTAMATESRFCRRPKAERFARRRISLANGKLVSLVPHETHPFERAGHRMARTSSYQQIVGTRSTHCGWRIASANIRDSSRPRDSKAFNAFTGAQPWSPDGKEILYESRRTGTSDLWVVPIDGGKPRQLTRDVRNDYFGSGRATENGSRSSRIAVARSIHG